jgi:hypothetical protein
MHMHTHTHAGASPVDNSLTATPIRGFGIAKQRTKSMPAPLVIRDRNSEASTLDRSISADGRPAWIKRRADLHEIPPSPPIVEANYLLEHDPTPNPAADHSIASPFVNADHVAESPTPSKRPAARRPSGLAHELGRMHVDDL